MSDHERSTSPATLLLCEIAHPTTTKSSCEIKAPHINGGHTFLVTTVVTEAITKTESKNSNSNSRSMEENLTAVPIISNANTNTINNSNNYNETTTLNDKDDIPSCSTATPTATKAVVPLSSSLPSKLLRFHAKRSAQALLHQMEQMQSLDSQFGSEDGGAVGGSGISDFATNDCADIFDALTPTAPPMSTPPPSSSPVSGDLLIDVGMGSSIADSEESEEDDELKPLAIDNHVLHDIDLSSSVERRSTSPLHEIAATSPNPPAVLSEANLEKFHKHHHLHQHAGPYHQMDNIYLHPNFKYELEDEASKDILETSPPPAVAPANSPIEQKRVHRSFLTMKKSTEFDNIIKPHAVLPHVAVAPLSSASVAATAELMSAEPQSLINEIDTLDPSMIPSDELCSEITDAVEFYFSNESILKDAFLLKHVRRNKEGFVSLKLVSSFKRVRQLTKEWKVVGYAVRQKSRKIELNDIGTKVRRLEALPNFDETMPSRTIVACDLPLDKLTIEKVSDIFSKCGEIALIRILKPGMAIPVDVRQFMNKYPEMQQKECTLVEYLESSSAREAKNLEGPFQVFEMVAPKKKTGKKAIIQVAAPVARMVENYRYYNDATYERTRGGSFSGVMSPHDTDLRYKLKRFNSDIHAKTISDLHAQQHGQHASYHHHHQPHQHHHHSPTHRGSYSSNSAEPHTHHFQHYQPRGSINNESATQAASSPSGNFFAYSPRRYSNTSTISANTAAALSDSPATAAAAAHSMSVINNNNSSNSNSNNNINTTTSSVQRRLSNCSDNNYSSFSEMSRRPSNCSETMSRRDSNCSENCPCSRRVSDFGQTEVYRKISQGSNGSIGGGVGGERRFSNGSMQFERTFSNSSELGCNNNSGGGNNAFPRRMSNDFNYERKQSLETQAGQPYDDGNVGGGGGGYNVFPRRYSNNFNVSNKLAAYDNAQYINGRRISTDSGYDRRYSFGSEYDGSPRSRTSSFLNNYKHIGGGGIDCGDGQPRSRTGSFLDGSPRSRSGSFAQRNAENLVRTPIGPDGSKGFGVRARKFGQTISPV